ncbi:MAG: carbon storage regulator CsrA [Planctomycetaceae bacterium]|jgi:carbon storage regulator|nr:carbon storage regulator CsrA [Planctomycetaceae bacterium]
MLVLTRNIDEVITIGDDIRVMIVDVRGDRVRIGIEAPRSVTVDREEVHKAKAAGSPAKKSSWEYQQGNQRSLRCRSQNRNSKGGGAYDLIG